MTQRRIILVAFILMSLLTMAQEKKNFTLDDLIPGGATYAGLLPENLHGMQWWGDLCVKPTDEQISILDPAHKMKETVLLTLEQVNSTLESTGLGKIAHFYNCSFPTAGKKEMLIQTAKNYIMYDFNNHTISWSIPTHSQGNNDDFCNANQTLAYTIDNNLYIASPNQEATAITNQPEDVVCGQSVHRSEFGIRKGTFWSPLGSKLAFYQMDERMVTDYPFVDISARTAKLKSGKYPMAGMNSHEVQIGIYDLSTRQTIYLNTGNPKNRYFTNIAWSPDEKSIYFIEVNRDQNHTQLLRYNASTGEKEALLIEESHPKYVEPEYPILFLKGDDSKFIYQSQQDGFNHLYLYDNKGTLIKQLTQGNWLVKEVLGFDETGKNLYISSTEASPLEAQTYKVELKTGKRSRITPATGMHSTQLSASGKYAIDRHTSKEVPRCIDLIEIEKGKITNLLTAQNPYEAYHTPTIETGTLKADDGVTDLYYRLIKPINFNPSQKYPTIIYVYGGPHAQVINNGWQNGARGWELYMASRGYVMFSVDNRGSSNRGMEFENATFRQLGVIEAKDQMKGVEYLKTLSFVDTARIGVHGWSFGGFMTTNLLLRYPETFKVGVGGGPVIDWSYYEIMYGERYMDTPQSNPEGYEESNLKNKAGKLKGHLLLIHGDEDPTCVLQHTLSFMKACIEAGTYPDLFIYPGHGHGISGKDRVHLNEKMTRYFDQNL